MSCCALRCYQTDFWRWSGQSLGTFSRFNAPLEIVAPDATLVPTVPAAIDLPALLAQSDAAMNQLRSVTKAQRVSDDSGNTITANYEYLAPDRLRFKGSSSAGCRPVKC